MKRILTIILSILVSSCHSVTDPVEYKHVTVMPMYESHYVPVHPVDVTTTEVDYY